MEKEVVVKIGDSLLTPFGLGTDENYEAVKKGSSCLQRHEGVWELPDSFMGAFVDDSFLEKTCVQLRIGKAYTRFEKMAMVVAWDAISRAGIDATQQDVVFVLATTKGNIHLLSSPDVCKDDLCLTHTATKITKWFGNRVSPLVVCNACISGLHAQIEAWRLLRSGIARTVVVLAADMLSPFIVSGFQAFKAVSDEPCRPFDENRLGLNLGEAAACVVYQNMSKEDVQFPTWSLEIGAVFNDAFHISHPSRTAEGSFRALKTVAEGYSAIDFALINVHGTATLYNDEMESVALHRAGFGDVPVNTLKGYFGHTMGAAGLLETLITMRALDDGVLLGTKGFSTSGVSHPVNISNGHRQAKGKRFIKLISGFGGCNAAARFEPIANV